MTAPTYQTIKLSRGKHHSPDEGACVMELASMLAGEEFSDHPMSVCPVIGALLRAHNDSIDDDRRQDLYAYVSRVVGSRSSGAVQDARAARLSEWDRQVRQRQREQSQPPWGLRTLNRLLRTMLIESHAHAFYRLPSTTTRPMPRCSRWSTSCWRSHRRGRASPPSAMHSTRSDHSRSPAGGDVGDRRPQHRSSEHIARVVHAGVDARVADHGRQHVERQRSERHHPPDPRRERDRSRRVSGGERVRMGHRDLPLGRHLRRRTVRSRAAADELDDDVHDR